MRSFSVRLANNVSSAVTDALQKFNQTPPIYVAISQTHFASGSIGKASEGVADMEMNGSVGEEFEGHQWIDAGHDESGRIDADSKPRAIQGLHCGVDVPRGIVAWSKGVLDPSGVGESSDLAQGVGRERRKGATFRVANRPSGSGHNRHFHVRSELNDLAGSVDALGDVLRIRKSQAGNVGGQCRQTQAETRHKPGKMASTARGKLVRSRLAESDGKLDRSTAEFGGHADSVFRRKAQVVHIDADSVFVHGGLKSGESDERRQVSDCMMPMTTFSGSANMAKCPTPGIGVLGTTTLPPKDIAF